MSNTVFGLAVFIIVAVAVGVIQVSLVEGLPHQRGTVGGY